MKRVLFIKNTVILTATALLLRSIGIFFRVWLTSKIGAEGIGLYQVVFSVYVLAATFATSGICTAVTRITTERLAIGDIKGCSKVLKISVLLSIFLAAVTTFIIIGFSHPISVHFIGDIRAEPAIKILCFSLPFMGASSCIRGYFMARRSSVPQSVCQIAEQIVRISLTVFLIGKYAEHGLTAAAAAVMVGDCIAEAASSVLIYLWYKIDKRRVKQKTTDIYKTKPALREIIRISFPISAGRYLHTVLRTIENVITPGCFSKYTGSRQSALEQFGMVKGMAIPLLLFPASLLSSVSTLLVPEITEASAKKDSLAVRAAVEKVFYITFITSFLIAAIFFCCSGQIGRLVYKSDGVGWLLRALSPLIPFMYIDLIADGILKGLDQQKIILRNSVVDSAIRILLVVFCVPMFGMNGFIGVMIFSNLFTSLLAVLRILKITNIKFNFKIFFYKPLFSASVSSVAAYIICKGLIKSDILYCFITTLMIIILYVVFLTFTGGIKTKALFNKSTLLLRKKDKTV